MSVTCMQDLFAHLPSSETMNLREKNGMREVCRLLIALHWRSVEISGIIDRMEARAFTGIW